MVDVKHFSRWEALNQEWNVSQITDADIFEPKEVQINAYYVISAYKLRHAIVYFSPL